MQGGTSMAMRWGTGPVFALECVAAARRWQTYATRAFAVGLLGLGLTMIWWLNPAYRVYQTARDLAVLGRSFYYAIAFSQLSLVLLAAPATAAGAICTAKARGSLLTTLTTDLSDAEIVLGTLAGRLASALGMVVATLPVLAIATLLGGIDPWALTMTFAISLALAVFGCSLALALSVWARRTQDVLMAMYLIWSAWLLSLPIWEILVGLGVTIVRPPIWFAYANPFVMVFAPYHDPGKVGTAELAAFVAGILAVSASATVVAVLRMRRVCVRQADGPSRSTRVRPARRWLPGPSLDRDPLGYRERRRARPSRWERAIWVVYSLIVVAGCAGSIVADHRGLGLVAKVAFLVDAIAVGLGLLMIAVSAPTALAEERSRGSLDVLMAAPVSTAAILRAKWRGTFRAVPPLAIAPTFLAAWIACDVFSHGGIASIPIEGKIFTVGLVPAIVLAHGAFITSLGLFLAVRIDRPGRAVAACVSICVVLGLGTASAGIFPGREDSFLLTAGPIIATGYVTIAIEGSVWRYYEDTFFFAAVWAAIIAGQAALLYLAALRTFDTQLGRMPEKPRRPGPLRRLRWAAGVDYDRTPSRAMTGSGTR